ncbi:hypothetical protein GCM10017786_17400 [Amycolatopsis deserti]|uniref:Uncharacterized protein n=1 Tax=Amycolatopsis deserti TaxID=185696 RepID=A0ABQ3IJI4_9PSEU|nr:hypothetical protein GCM10017786_17400 [Amycolatopsis deserti]
MMPPDRGCRYSDAYGSTSNSGAGGAPGAAASAAGPGAGLGRASRIVGTTRLPEVTMAAGR